MKTIFSFFLVIAAILFPPENVLTAQSQSSFKKLTSPLLQPASVVVWCREFNVQGVSTSNLKSVSNSLLREYGLPRSAKQITGVLYLTGKGRKFKMSFRRESSNPKLFWIDRDRNGKLDVKTELKQTPSKTVGTILLAEQ